MFPARGTSHPSPTASRAPRVRLAPLASPARPVLPALLALLALPAVLAGPACDASPDSAGQASAAPASPGEPRPVAPRPESAQRDGEARQPTPAPPALGPDPVAPASSPATRRTPDHGPISTEVGKPPAALARTLRLARVARGLKRPVALEHAPGDRSGRLFVVEQHVARIRILRPRGAGFDVVRQPFLSLGGRVSRGNEQGLLGLAFHPDFAANRKLYVYYTDRRGTTRVVEYRVHTRDPDRVDHATAREIFTLEQPYSNHNAGDLEFGPDGKLYVGTGDGGAAGDPLRAGQDAKNLLAKMLRFDVDRTATGPVQPEIVQLGLRNPWRYHFDRETGDLYIGDVGQNAYEFLYVVAAGDIDGHNFGWNIVEGNHCYRRRTCDKSKFTPAVIEYPHSVGCSITGGEVYRGKALPELHGVYFYADYCKPVIRSLRWSSRGVQQHWDWRAALDPDERISEISSFGHDADGELYVVSLRGSVYRLIRRPS